MNPNVMGRLASRFKERMASTTTRSSGSRFDLQLWDHTIAGPHQAKILIGFSDTMGMPTRSDIEQFVLSIPPGGELRTVPESIRHHNRDGNLITATVIKIPQVRPVEHSASMVRVGSSTFMDQKEQIWEMKKNGDEAFIARVEKENIDEILRLKEQQSKTASVHHRPRLASLTTAGVTNPTVGDHVSVVYEGSVQYGKVTKVAEGTVTVALNGKSVDMPQSSIIEVKELSPASKQEQDQFLIDFFTKAYGDAGFARKLVKG